MWIRTAALALLISTPLMSRADPRLFSPDVAIESSTETLTAPLAKDGPLLARSCIACKSEALRLTPRTRFFIGKRQVTVAEINKLLQSGATHGLGIFYDRQAHTVTQLIVFVDSPQRTANSRA